MTNSSADILARCLYRAGCRHAFGIPGGEVLTLIDGLEKWIQNWKRKGWKTASGKPVLNQDLWKALDDPQLPKIKLEFVKGHSGEKDNDRVDQIAVCFSKRKKIYLKSANDKK